MDRDLMRGECPAKAAAEQIARERYYLPLQPIPDDTHLDPVTEIDGISYYARLAGIPMEVLYPAKLVIPNTNEHLQSE